MSAPTALPADGFTARWETWDGVDLEEVTLRWENEAWTATGSVGRERIQYVMRISPLWHVRQFLLFRDLDDPDLWRGTVGSGHWGEMNGAHRTDLDGCTEIALGCTPFEHVPPLRRHHPDIDHEVEVRVMHIDVETLGITRSSRRYRRLGERRWSVDDGTLDTVTEFSVDPYGLPLDIPGRFRRR